MDYESLYEQLASKRFREILVSQIRWKLYIYIHININIYIYIFIYIYIYIYIYNIYSL